MSGNNARLLRALAWAGLLGLLLQVPSGLAATIRQLVEVVDIGNVSVSPDGRLVAFRTEQASIERNTYETVWYVQPVDGASPPRRLGEGGETLRDTGGQSVLEPAHWAPDSRWIFYRATRDGRIDLWRAVVDGSLTEQVSHDAANVRSFSVSGDGDSVRYSVGASREAVADAELAEYDHGIRIDSSVSLADSLFRSGFHEGRLATQRQDAHGVYGPLLDDVPDRWKSVDLATGVVRELPEYRPTTPASDLGEGVGEVEQVVPETGGNRIGVLTRVHDRTGPAARSWVELAMLSDRRSGRKVSCTDELCRGKQITDMVWRPRSDEIVFTVTDRDRGLNQSLFRWNVVSGVVSVVAMAAGQLSGGGRFDPGPCSVSSAALVCVTAEADRPPRLERVDLASGTRSVLFDPNPLLAQDMKDSPQVRFFDWIDRQGRHVTGRYYPAAKSGRRPSPLFVAYYRCPGFVRGGLGDEWPLASFAKAGIAGLCLNALPLVDDAAVRYQDAVASINGAVDELAARGEVDPDRVGLGGLSFGAEVSLWATTSARLPRAVSVSTPVISPLQAVFFGLEGTVESQRMRRYWQLGSPSETPERWQQLSPAYHLNQIRSPVLMQMSEQEYRLSLDYAVPLIREHRADAYVFPNEQHQKFQPRHKLAVYQRNLDWFRFWLLDEEDTDPSKAGQYRVWRQMKVGLSAGR